MALTQCTECGQQVSDLALACPHCGAPPPVGGPPSTIEITKNSEYVESAFDSVRETLKRGADAVSSAGLKSGDTTLIAGFLCIVAGVFLPLVRRPVGGSVLSYYEHSHFSAAVLITITLIGVFSYLLRRKWVTLAAGVAVSIITGTVLFRLHSAFAELFHPAMRFKVGSYLIFGGAALFIVASKLEGAISVLPEVAGSVDSKQKQSGGAQSEAKALFDAWLRQQGIPADITLAERQSCYEVFHTLYVKGELDLIGLRRATREQDK